MLPLRLLLLAFVVGAERSWGLCRMLVGSPSPRVRMVIRVVLLALHSVLLSLAAPRLTSVTSSWPSHDFIKTRLPFYVIKSYNRNGNDLDAECPD